MNTLNLSNELSKLYSLKRQLSEIINVISVHLKKEEAEMLDCESTESELAGNEVEDLVSEGYTKVMCYQAFEDYKVRTRRLPHEDDPDLFWELQDLEAQ